MSLTCEFYLGTVSRRENPTHSRSGLRGRCPSYFRGHALLGSYLSAFARLQSRGFLFCWTEGYLSNLFFKNVLIIAHGTRTHAVHCMTNSTSRSRRSPETKPGVTRQVHEANIFTEIQHTGFSRQRSHRHQVDCKIETENTPVRPFLDARGSRQPHIRHGRLGRGNIGR